MLRQVLDVAAVELEVADLQVVAPGLDFRPAGP